MDSLAVVLTGQDKYAQEKRCPSGTGAFAGRYLLDKEHPDTLTWLHRLHISPRKEPTLIGTRMNAIVDRGYLNGMAGVREPSTQEYFKP
jgi:hypothetical protein